MSFDYKGEQLIGKVTKNSVQEIRVRTATINGAPRVDARIFFQSNLVDGTEQSWRPSKSGVNLDAEGARELASLLVEAAASVRPEGEGGGQEEEEAPATGV